MSLSLCAARAFLTAAALVAFASPSWAVDFGTFACITDNVAGDCAIGESQLSATIVPSGADALLTITMTGFDDAVVEQLSIESSLITALSFSASGGIGDVTFGTAAAGGNLPGGNQPSVNFNEAFTIESTNPPPRRGIGHHSQDQTSGQSGLFLLSYSGGDLDAFLDSLRIGVHVIGYSSDGSESFVSTPVPEPSSFALIALGFAGATFAGRRSVAR